MLFVAGDAEDEAGHKAFCRVATMFRVTLTKACRIVSVLPSIERSLGENKIVSIDGSKFLLMESMQGIITEMTSDLGSNIAYIEDSIDLMCYLFLLNNGAAGGCVMVESVSLKRSYLYYLVNDRLVLLW